MRDLKDFPEGAILVARHTSPKFVTVMNKANAIITDFGGATGHMATLAREFQVPAIVDTEVATKILENGQEITVDAINCTIYEGIVNEPTSCIKSALLVLQPLADSQFTGILRLIKEFTISELFEIATSLRSSQ